MLGFARILKRLLLDIWLAPVNYITGLLARPVCCGPVIQDLVDNGPFVVVPKPHQWRDRGRIKRALCFAITKEEPKYLYYGDDKYSLKQKALHITGKKGQWCVADTISLT